MEENASSTENLVFAHTFDQELQNNREGMTAYSLLNPTYCA